MDGIVTAEVRVPVVGNRTMRAALVLPAGPGPWPAVIVLHEIFGLNEDIRGKARRFAERGYVALAPDLYDARGPAPICIVRTLHDLRHGSGETFADLDAVRHYLAGRSDVDASRIGVIGFCMGGGFALLFAVRAPLGAAAVFYGDVPPEVERLQGVCPVVAGYGERDRVFAPQGRRLEAHLTRLGVPHDVKRYSTAGHSFMSKDYHGPQAALVKLSAHGPMHVGFDPAAAEDSWRRVDAFFDEHLRQT